MRSRNNKIQSICSKKDNQTKILNFLLSNLSFIMKKNVFNIGQQQSSGQKDNLTAMIEDSLSYSNNKLNISFDEKD